MSMRYRDREDYGRRRDSEYGRSYGNESHGRYGRGGEESERYSGENRWRGQYGSSMSSRSGREYEGRRQDYGRDWETERDYEGNREYGESSPLGIDAQRRFREASSSYSQRYDYPSDYPTRDMYGNAGNRPFDYDRGRYGRGAERGYEYERDRYGSGSDEDRGWWDRASDAVSSWFGDEEAERRRRMDQRDEYRGRGPKGYRRSDERIKEDVNDRLSEGYLDATEIEVAVQNAEVTLTGTVNSRRDKRRAEDIADSVTGVTHVENRLRVKQSGYSSATTGYGNTATADTSGMSSSSGQSTATARGRSAGT
jgi:osmotically-inducible protein OsmY